MALFSYKPEGREAAIGVVRAAIDEREDVRLYELLGWLYMEGKDFNSAYDVYRTIDKLSGSNGTGILSFADRAFREGVFDLAARRRTAQRLTVPLPAGAAARGNVWLCILAQRDGRGS